jgi:hypothetical protein
VLDDEEFFELRTWGNPGPQIFFSIFSQELRFVSRFHVAKIESSSIAYRPYHVENVDFYVKNEIFLRLKLIKGKNV